MIRNCDFCDAEYDTKNHGDKYCSRACQSGQRKKESEAKRKRACQWCGKEFVMRWESGQAKNGEVKEGLFCSRKCRWDWRKAQPKKYYRKTCKVYFQACPICGKSFTSRRPKARCSIKCDVQYFQKKRTPDKQKPRPCKECGSMFTPKYGEKRDVFCSEFCMKRYGKRISGSIRRARKHGNRYERFDPVVVLQRDHWTCQICGRKTPKRLRGTIEDNAPELDHIVPLAEGGEHSMCNVQCLCRACNEEKGTTVKGQMRLC